MRLALLLAAALMAVATWVYLRGHERREYVLQEWDDPLTFDPKTVFGAWIDGRYYKADPDGDFTLAWDPTGTLDHDLWPGDWFSAGRQGGHAVTWTWGSAGGHQETYSGG